MSMKPYKVDFLLTENQRVSFRAHNTDPNLMVAKAKHPEAVDNLIVITGVDAEVQKKLKGHSNHITVMTKKGGAALIAAAALALATKDEVYGNDDDADDGVDDEAKALEDEDE